MKVMLAKNIGMAVHTMRANRGRSLLTMLGVIIAVASVTSVVSIGDGIKAALTTQANQYSKDVITVQPGRLSTATGPLAALTSGAITTPLTHKDAVAIGNVSHVSSSVPLMTVGTSAQGDYSFRGAVFAVSTDLPKVVNQELEYGAFFTDRDNNSLAVLGATAADKLFDQRVPLGRSFTINGQQFIVSGVLSPFASTPLTSTSNFNNAIFVSEDMASQLAPNGAPIYEILAKVDADKNLQQADKHIESTVAKRHHGQHDFTVLTPTELADQTTRTFELLAKLILAAAIITLIVSGIGIMNVMLVSITERVHEIGIRKAVGATNYQILGQFITEAAVLCVAGSIIGALVALVVVGFLKVFTSLTPAYDWRVAALSFLAACLFGIIFGTLPAIKAARKDPIAALRNE
jgi:ABC-type antimicrobial peptide transport system permease subunit